MRYEMAKGKYGESQKVIGSDLDGRDSPQEASPPKDMRKSRSKGNEMFSFWTTLGAGEWQAELDDLVA